MAQTNAVQDQPTMDDILASIRRIIDDGNKKPETSVPSQASVANDDAAAPSKSVEPVATAKAAPAPAAEIGIPELDSFLESLDAKYENGAQDGEQASNVVTLETQEAEAPVAADDIEVAPAGAPARVASKYEARFSDTDRTAFAEVGDALSARTSSHISRAASPALLSENTRQAVGLSFEDLSAALMKEAGRDLPGLTEQMLKPMLSDWLDNNLPSMVERLVRGEIERIARGE